MGLPGLPRPALRAPVALGTLMLALSLASADPFPAVRPALRAQVASLAGAPAPLSTGCLTPLLPPPDSPASGLSLRKALGLFGPDGVLPGERRVVTTDGIVLRYTLERGSPDRIDPADEDGNGQPDLVEAVLNGVQSARHTLVDQLDLPRPGPIEIVLARLGGSVEGVTIPAAGGGSRTALVLESTPRWGAAGARREAVHQYAHAVALALGAVPAGWGEALAVWTTMGVDRSVDARTADLLSRRLERLPEGLFPDDPELGAGNALWLAFLEEQYGSTTVALTVRELATGAAPGVALDRALRRGAGATLDAAFREFHAWTVLVGDRSDGKHFSFADRLATPRPQASSDGLPVLSVRADPAVAPLGAVTLRIGASEMEGGLTLRFEGEIPGRWEADLLLVSREGRLRRVPMPLGGEGSGEVTVPAQGLKEVLLLARNLESDDHRARRYTWAAHADRGYPFELAALQAGRSADEGTLVTWETTSERGLVGYNVFRVPAEGGAPIRLTPVRIPAVGDSATPASYQFLDPYAEAGVPYLYRIEGITLEGLSSFSELVSPAEDGSAR